MNRLPFFLVVLFCTSFSLEVKSQLVPLGNSCFSTSGLYVDAFDAIAGNPSTEDSLLAFSRNNGMNYLLFYGLNRIMGNAVLENQTAQFIKKAKNEYGIHKVSAVMETALDVETYVQFNQARPVDERFDVFTLEFEFWSSNLSGLGYCDYLTEYENCDRASAFDFFIKQIQRIEEFTSPINVESEVYIGWPTEAEAITIADNVDRVLVHFYRTTDVDIINYGQDRIINLSKSSKGVKVAPIFSSEGPGNTDDIPFMGEWLTTHPIDQAFNTWASGFEALDFTTKDNLDVIGNVWFVYGRFDQSNISHITGGPLNQEVCLGDDITLTVTSSSMQTQYYWLKDNECLKDGTSISGATTATLSIQDLNSNDLGAYRCRIISYDESNPSSFSTQEAEVSLSATCTDSQLSYLEDPISVPGVVECELYDFGGENVSYHDVNPARESENKTFRADDGVDLQDNNEDDGYHVSYFVSTEWLEYSIDISTIEDLQMTARVAIGIQDTSMFHLELDGVDITGPIQAFPSGGWESWVLVDLGVLKPTLGEKVLRLVLDDGNANFDKLEFSLVTAGTENESIKALYFYPNPSSGSVYVNQNISGLVVNEMGEEVLVLKNTNVIDLSNLVNGVYFLRAEGTYHKLLKQ